MSQLENKKFGEYTIEDLKIGTKIRTDSRKGSSWEILEITNIVVNKTWICYKKPYKHSNSSRVVLLLLNSGKWSFA